MSRMEQVSTPWGTTLREEHRSPVGVSEGYSLEQHNQMFLKRLREAPSALHRIAPHHLDLPRTAQEWTAFLAIVAELHDAGKPEAVRRGDVRRQHELTLDLLEHLEQTRQLPWSTAEYALARALIDGPTDKREPDDGDAIGALLHRLSML